ncbi:cytosolic 5'-nucleotidase 3-like [Polypterus senegalus]|uniref:cytosolic 5'-nucleotidase 3-like n=1 Tax=Polypterus senegalus TaxID=55291 RepID=UPI001965882F|nr:cytosolic 5'-nucleotidase 3-like [Polypterus senegalus]
MSVHILNRKKVEDTLECFRKGGPSRVQVISDFDMTLTRFAYNGTRVPTCHSIIDNSRLISEEGKKKGILQGFKGDLIHTYNKHEGALKNSGHFEKLDDKRNVILLGDSLGDLQMADGVENMENILKIGYLNDKVDKLRGQYLEGYDIVLEKDETLNVVNAILQYISAQN